MRMTGRQFAEPAVLIDDGALVLPGFALSHADGLIAEIGRIAAEAPFRCQVTPGGRRMSVAMTSAGPLGWISGPRGYAYSPVDPDGGRIWPAMSPTLAMLATDAAAAAGFSSFHPDSCLVNRYEAGARMGLHQDRDEADLTQPIVSVSLGLPATFLWGGASRAGSPRRMMLEHGDVVVWGGPSRRAFHGIAPLKPGYHPATGAFRYNITFRHAGAVS